MEKKLYSPKKVAQIFGINPEDLLELNNNSKLPQMIEVKKGIKASKYWCLEDLPEINKIIGAYPVFNVCKVASLFTIKGGVLKSTLTLNLARLASLSGLRVLVVGLDIQGDISSCLGVSENVDENMELEEVLGAINRVQGLADVYFGRSKIEDVIVGTNIPTLFAIPETPELAVLAEHLANARRREYWLKDQVVAPLRNSFDLILFDCSPNWTILTTNALVAQDILISPLECKINNFRNFQVFKHLLDKFEIDMGLSFSRVFVPTRFSPQRKLSAEIFEWYKLNIPNCLDVAIKESAQGEEATALGISVPEHCAVSPFADDVRLIFNKLIYFIEQSYSNSVENSVNNRNHLDRPLNFASVLHTERN